MKVVILCGGLGTRISEETSIKPKPMVEIGGIPILMHIINVYRRYGFNDFILALGYKGYYIKEFFSNYYKHRSDFTVNLGNGKINYFGDNLSDDFNVTLIDTGHTTMTGGRLLRLKKYLNSRFMLTYGDGLSNININLLLKSHIESNKLATMTVVRPPVRFGEINISNNIVQWFKEKPQSDTGWINGGFFVFEPEVFNFINDDSTILESGPIESLVANQQLNAYQHNDFWQCMDTLRDKNYLEKLYYNKEAPWI